MHSYYLTSSHQARWPPCHQFSNCKSVTLRCCQHVDIQETIPSYVEHLWHPFVQRGAWWWSGWESWVLCSWTHLSFFAIFAHFILRSWSLVPHSFPYAPLGPPPNHLTSHLMDHLTIPQSDITCHHSAVCSILQYHHLTLLWVASLWCATLRPPAHDGAILRIASSWWTLLYVTLLIHVLCYL